MTQVDDVGRPAVPLAADEAGTLLGFLEYQRATLAWKCAGLDAGGLVATVGPSTMTLGGLLKHLTRVEDIWFSQRLHGRKAEPPWDTVPWAAEWKSAAEDTPEELHTRWRDAVARSRTRVAEAMADGGLDRPATGIPSSWGPEPPRLRWILVHMIEEYARHNGHADLLRESVDGATGE